MATLRETITTLLDTDARSAEAGSLGVLLGYDADTKADCVFFAHPPAEPALPLVTYYFNAQSGRFPRDIYISITAWGNNFEAIQNRIYALLHDATIVSTDFATLMLKWDWAGPEMFDDSLKCYYCQHRFWVKGIKT